MLIFGFFGMKSTDYCPPIIKDEFPLMILGFLGKNP